MATLLGLILTLILGIGCGAWAAYEVLRHHNMLLTFQQRAEQLTHYTINDILDRHRMSGRANITVLPKTGHPSPNGDDAA